jgi:hypothetical protein
VSKCVGGKERRGRDKRKVRDVSAMGRQAGEGEGEGEGTAWRAYDQNAHWTVRLVSKRANTGCLNEDQTESDTKEMRTNHCI